MNFQDRPYMNRTKYPVKTVVVAATTKPPTPGFRHGGKVIEFDEQVRISLGDAQDLVHRGKARIVEGTEEMVTM